MRIERIQTAVPWAMAAGRAALGPLVIAGAVSGWSPQAMAGMVVAALVSDIFDGVLARRWACDTAGVRLFDSMADTVFYVCVAVALWVAQPEVLRANAWLMGVLFGLELVRFAFDLAKFGRAASYHSYLAKTWGLVMAIAVVGVFALGRGNGLVPVALGLGILCDVEGLVMSAMLPMWRRDVKTMWAAARLRTEMFGRAGLPRGRGETLLVPKVLGVILAVAIFMGYAVPAAAVEEGKTVFANGCGRSRAA